MLLVKTRIESATDKMYGSTYSRFCLLKYNFHVKFHCFSGNFKGKCQKLKFSLITGKHLLCRLKNLIFSDNSTLENLLSIHKYGLAKMYF